MENAKNRVFGLLLLTCGSLFLVQAAPAAAQDAPGFLFGTPHVTLSLNMGYGIPNTGSDLFQEVDTLLTLGMSDFNGPVVGGSFAVHLNNRLDLAFDVTYLGSSTWSEYRDFVEELDGGQTIPIEQETKFTRVPVTLSLRYRFMDHGREISQFAWVPTKWSPYVGFGAGRVYSKFEQDGDFVDFYDYSIFGENLISEDWAWTAHALGGVEYSLSARMVLTAEGRYSWAEADLDRNFYQGYEPLDLSGFQGTFGIGVRF